MCLSIWQFKSPRNLLVEQTIQKQVLFVKISFLFVKY